MIEGQPAPVGESFGHRHLEAAPASSPPRGPSWSRAIAPSARRLPTGSVEAVGLQPVRQIVPCSLA